MEQARDRPALAPGVRVVRLGERLVQVGLEHTGAVRLPLTPLTESVLTALRTGQPPPSDGADLLAELAARGLVVDRTRPRATVAVFGECPVDPAPLLAASGLEGTTDPDEADVVLLAGQGELDRELLAPLVRSGIPHLPVRLVDGLAVLGPFAVPGASACLRCVDLHRAADDAAHLLLVDRYSRLPGAATDLATDLVLATLAVAWAVRDLATWAAGGCPSTWSRTVRVGPSLGEVVAHRWWRHPECGCTWTAHPSATMEA